MLVAPAERRRSRRQCSKRWKRRFRKAKSKVQDGEIQKEDGMRKIFGWTAIAVLAGGFLLAGVTGCKSNDLKQSAEGNAASATPAPAPLDPNTLGMVSGTI